MSHPPTQGEDTHTMTYESAAAHAECSSAHPVQRTQAQQRTQTAAARTKCSIARAKCNTAQKCNSARNVQQHTQRAATHAKCSSARKVQLRTLDVDGYHLNGTMIAFHHGNLGCASVSVCGKFTWSKLLVGTSPQYDRVIFCADARSNPHHDTNLGSCSGYA